MIKKLNNSIDANLAKVPLPGWVAKLLNIIFWTEAGLIIGLTTASDRPDLVEMAHKNGFQIITVLFVITGIVSIIRGAKETQEQETLHD